MYVAMGWHKHIEHFFGDYIARNYRKVAEIGIGKNITAALIIREEGLDIFCTDIRTEFCREDIPVIMDDIFSPRIMLYSGLELIYSIRPAVEMIPPMIALARRVGADLLVYHLGFEGYGDGGELIDCGVILHRYHASQNPSKRVF
ncbi:MAG TPA: UPF0146 family protein [Methanoregulaceae archaeon]|nr:UPF0146 family protein [Methanoregulaceae archaeon]